MSVSGVTVDPRELLRKHFGWEDYREGQAEVIQRLFDGKSALAVFPTGAGKSLCYQLPALTFDGVTVVVSPLIALMKDQIDQLKSRGVAAVRLDSTLTLQEYRDSMQELRSGSAKILYVAPERFFNERFRSVLDSLSISLFAVDESHCISQWGHNFRPDYLKLAPLVKKLGVKRVLALTATATPAVQKDICEAFEIAQENVVCTRFFRPNLHLGSTFVSKTEQVDTLIDKLKTNRSGPAIIYVTLQKTAEKIAGHCMDAGLKARPYHAGLATETRTEVQDWFMQEADAIVVATIAFGMGIDKSDIRYVYHFNPPKSLENYAQEIGRAGRDGDISQCEMIVVAEDRIVLENFVFGDTPTRASVARFVDEVAKLSDEFTVSHYKLSSICDIKILVLRTMLTYLELDGFLVATAPRYDSYSFKPNVPSSEIVDHFEGERKGFSKKLLALSIKRKTWFELDVEKATQSLGCTRQRVVAAMEYFQENGWIELRVSGLVHGYRKLKSIESPEKLVDSLVQIAEKREHAEIARIDQVFDLASAKECQSATLSRHFGQKLDSECGTCSSCVGRRPAPIVISNDSNAVPDSLKSTLKEIVQLKTQHATALSCPRSTARFLCGISSPALTSSKLTRHPLFGSCAGVPFASVMQQLNDEL